MLVIILHFKVHGGNFQINGYLLVEVSKECTETCKYITHYVYMNKSGG
jgi:hypothetical protein